MKCMKIILLAGVLLLSFSSIKTALAQDNGFDWNNKPWLVPRVIQCVREYLDRVVIPINEERRRKNLATYWRFDDWGRSVNEYSTPDPRVVDGQWDNPTHFVWGFFKSPHLGGVQRYVKEECVPGGGDGPGQDPPPPPPPQAGDDKCCEEYASLAVCQQRLNIELDCGLTEPPARWHLDYQVHYDWCVVVAENFADFETRIRERLLSECFGERAPEYDRSDRGDGGPPEDVTGIWDVYIRVVNTTKDIVATTLAINQTAGGNFSGSGSGIDNNGVAISISISGHYGASTNEINGTITTTFEKDSLPRTDQFSTRLTSNDTGYIPTTFVSGDRGSDGEIRLVKQ